MEKKSKLIAIILSVLLAVLFINAADSSLCSDSDTKEKPKQKNVQKQVNTREEIEIEEEEVPLEILANDFYEEDSFDVDMNEVYSNTVY